LVVACCRDVPRGGALDSVRELAAGADPVQVAAVAKRHRVEGIVHHALSRAGVSSPLADAAAHIARRNLVQAAEAKRVDDLLEAAAIARVFVKGATLEMLAWESLALKTSVDIDLLVDPARYRDACAILFEAGYRCTHPGDFPPARIEAYALRAKDSVWYHRRRGIQIDLHHRLAANPSLLPAISAHSPSQMVELAPGIALPTLAPDALFAYLSVHGALTAWSRLKWAADLNALVSREPDLEALYRRALPLAPGRATAQGLLLCEALFGLPLGPLAQELRRDSRNLWLRGVALATLVRGGPQRELSDQRLGTARLHYSILFLQPGWRYKASDLGRQLMRLIRR
jgi:hypothetical protein